MTAVLPPFFFADMDVIRYGRRRHALRWSKKQVDTVKRIWESIDLDRDQTVTRAELELFLESGLTEEFAAGGDAEAGDGHTEGVGIGLGRLLVKSGLGRRQHIHFRDMVKVFFTGGLMKSPHITERDIDEIVEYAYPRVRALSGMLRGVCGEGRETRLLLKTPPVHTHSQHSPTTGI